MRPNHLNLHSHFTSRVLVPAAAVPALHQLAAFSGQRLRRQQPPALEGRLPLRDLLCCRASNGWHCNEAAEDAKPDKSSILQGQLCNTTNRAVTSPREDLLTFEGMQLVQGPSVSKQ